MATIEDLRAAGQVLAHQVLQLGRTATSNHACELGFCLCWAERACHRDRAKNRRGKGRPGIMPAAVRRAKLPPFGIRRGQDAICVYVDRETASQAELFNDIRAQIEPHRLLIVEEDKPQIMD